MNRNPTTTTTPQIKTRRCRKRLRRLANNEEDAIATSAFNGRSVIFVVALILCCVAAAVWQNEPLDNTAINILENFMRSYRRHYIQILYGRQDYCVPQMNTKAMFGNMLADNQILHQDTAVHQLKVALHNEDANFSSIALVGPPGVGKTMMARALAQHWPWHESVNIYMWNTYVHDEVEKFHLLRLFVEQRLSDCGRNLLIIDNIPPCDLELVKLLSHLIESYSAESHRNLAVVVIYIFSLNTMAVELPLEYQANILQDLVNTTTINFRRFTIDEVKHCIQNDLREMHLQLSTEDFEEIVATIDAAQSGCKNVRAKISALGTPVT